MKSLEIDPYTYSKLIVAKGGKAMQSSKDSFLIKCCWNNWTATCKKHRHRLIPFTNKLKMGYRSKWVIDQNVKCKTIKLEENIGENLTELGYGDDFLVYWVKIF